MIYLLSIVFVLSILVFFHELGHFLLAKLFGVRVERFSIGFPPRLFGIKLGETDYCISAIPFGGYVKMAGMIDESMDTSSLTGEPYEFTSKSWWQKTLILVGGVTMNMVLAWIIFSSLLFTEGKQIITSTTVGYVQEGGVAAKTGFQVKDKILTIDGKPVKNWNEVAQMFVSHLGSNIDFQVERDGQVKEIVIPASILKMKESEQLDMSPMLLARIGEVLPDSPASEAGLKPGDKIVSINGQPIVSWDEMTEVIRSNPDKPLSFVVSNNGETREITITPKPTDEIDEEGKSNIVGKIGAGPYFEKLSVPFFTSFKEGFTNTLFVTSLNVKAIGWLVTGKKSPREMLGGPIMITKLAGEFAKTGFGNLMALIANLSIMLAIVNILPIPALDGGHIMIIMIEEIRRKPLSTQTKVKIQQVGMALLLILIVFVMYNDILRLF